MAQVAILTTKTFALPPCDMAVRQRCHSCREQIRPHDPNPDGVVYVVATCPVCLQDVSNIKTFFCGHFTCPDCFKDWISPPAQEMEQEPEVLDVPMVLATQEATQEAYQAPFPHPPWLRRWTTTPFPPFTFCGSRVMWVNDAFFSCDYSLIDLTENFYWQGRQTPPPPASDGTVMWEVDTWDTVGHWVFSL